MYFTQLFKLLVSYLRGTKKNIKIKKDNRINLTNSLKKQNKKLQTTRKTRNKKVWFIK